VPISRFSKWKQKVKLELQRAFAEDYSSRETAGSFSLGVFITMLPTLGVGLLVFVFLAWVFDRVNKVALLASVIVCNPVVKWGVYAASFAIGVALLGPVPGATPTSFSLSAGPDIVSRLLLGNLILAVLAAVPSYFICYRFVEQYNERDSDIIDDLEEVIYPDEDIVNSD